MALTVSYHGKLSRATLSSLASVVVLVLLLGLIRYAWIGNWKVTLAISLGALGGLLHEFAQSHGSIFMPGKQADKEFYVGSLGGVLVGAIAGILAIQSILTTAPSEGTPTGVGSAFAYALAFSAFVAGLGLKGVAEAVTTSPTAAAPDLKAPPNEDAPKSLRSVFEELLGPVIPPKPRI
jgi:hypothetical protein